MYIGVDIGGTKCAVTKGALLENGDISILQKIRFDTVGVNETLDKIIESIESLGDFESIGISCGGPLDEEAGVILSPPNLPGWDAIRIKEILKTRFGVPVALRNDANACALAEWRFGAGRLSKNMVFLTFGTGLGAGLILDGKLYSGTNGMAGEVGHIRLAPDGPRGYGKCGSFEGFCSGGGIAELGRQRARAAILRGSSAFGISSESDLSLITTRMLAELAAGGDEDAKDVFRESATRLGEGLSVIIDILNPEVIVIGSVYARCEELFVEGMKSVLQREALSESLSVCRILPAALGENIGDLAAISVAIEAK